MDPAGSDQARNPYSPPRAAVADADSGILRALPRPVRRAVILMFASYVLNAVILGLDWRYELSQNLPLVLLISEAVALAITIWLAWKITAGRNWARIVLLILTVISVPATFAEAITTAPRVAHIAGLKLFEMGLDIAVVYLLFFPGDAFFRRGSATDVQPPER